MSKRWRMDWLELLTWALCAMLIGFLFGLIT